MDYIVVTSSCPFSHEKISSREVNSISVGGVATALNSMITKYGGTWICWGKGGYDEKYTSEELGKYKIKRIILDKHEKLGYYDYFSNGVMWPLFHYFRQNIKIFNDSYKTYYNVNKKFAYKIMEDITDNTIIWIHDYQLTMVPEILRENGINNKIIFTWHIPWVSPEFFSIIPQAKDIMKSLSKSDIITFHTKIYEKNFISTYKYMFRDKLKSKVYALPLGIDNKYFSSFNNKMINLYNIKNRKIIFSIDRLDYTKGLINRILAIEGLLRRHPEYINKFVYIMNVTPSRSTVADYISMKRELEMTIGRVNGEFSTINWSPIKYMYRKIKTSTLISYYKTADIALITPLIDGLNLVSKEFISVTEKGILILSKFAGSAYTMKDALIVNPYDINEMANAIIKAIKMPENEIKERLTNLKEDVETKNSEWWYKKIISIAEK